MWAESVYVFLCDCWQLQAPSLVDSPSDDALMTSASSNDWHNTSQKQLTMLQLSHRVLTATDSICSNNTQIIERRSYKGNHLVTLTKKYKMQQKNHNKTNIIQIWVLLPQFTRVYSGEWRRTSQHTQGVETDASTRSSNITAASCNFAIYLLTPKVDHSCPCLIRQPLVPICSKTS